MYIPTTTNGIDELLLNLEQQDKETSERIKLYYSMLCKKGEEDKLLILDKYYFNSYRFASFTSFCNFYALNINTAKARQRAIRKELIEFLSY